MDLLSLHAHDVVGLGAIFTGGWWGIFRLKSLRKETTKKFDHFVDKWESDISQLVDEYGIENIDIQYESDEKIKKNPCNEVSVVRVIGNEFIKGYDFLHSNLKSGYRMESHKHTQSCEFIYILSGKFSVEVEGVERILLPNEHIYIEAEKNHTIEAMEDCEIICVALPPLITGLS